MRGKALIPAVSILLFVILCPHRTMAQTESRRFEVGAQIVSLAQRAFDKVDCGFGGRFTYYPQELMGIEAEVNYFPRDLGKPLPFSRFRSQALFGIKAGPRVGPFGFYGRIRPGFVGFAEPSAGLTCAAVFPTPLECTVADRPLNFALDIGGGIELLRRAGDTSSRRSHLAMRVDVGDTMIRFRGPALTKLGRFDGPFNVHNFQLSVGIAWRFHRR